MQLKKYLLNKLPAITGLILVFSLTSCGSYQYVGQESDGIYVDDTSTQEVTYAEVEESSNSDYYKNYFKEKSLELEAADNEVFVDIDSYQGNYEEGVESEGYGAWGDNGNEVTINVYDNNYSNWGWTMPYWGWNRFGWNRPYYGWNSGFGFNGFGWNAGFGFSGGFYNPYWFPNYGYGFGYSNYYNTGYYYNRRGAFNRSRRNALASRYTSLNGRNYNNSARLRSNSTRTRSRVNSSTRFNNNNNTNIRTRSRVKTNSSTSPSRVKSNRTRVRSNTTPTRTRTRVNSTPRSNRSYSSPSRSSSSSRASSGSRSSSRRRG
ncbi:hypothetical protein [Lacinutrix sp. MedPE-SW]|uniref:hypothetical protein n=1 Tax=Lacinutrix sp. MedPE-SW TaxID=1860087 RepID=UPI000911B2D9|nr:hypothetical protein [Lacinutrix sp. MedPE-SW]OIQ19502.1 MAG: hypothetical protein BM549_11215 [Lacinutrix sp. MedPE-SW]